MNTAVIITKTDPVVKKRAQEVAKEIGVSLSSLINAYLRQIIKTKTVTFSARPQEEPSEYLIKTIKQAEKNYKEGKASPVFTNAKDAIKYLEDQGI